MKTKNFDQYRERSEENSIFSIYLAISVQNFTKELLNL